MPGLPIRFQKLCKNAFDSLVSNAVVIGDTLIFEEPMQGPDFLVFKRTDIKVKVHARQISRADQMNGLEWQGDIELIPELWEWGSSGSWRWWDLQTSMNGLQYLCSLIKSKGQLSLS